MVLVLCEFVLSSCNVESGDCHLRQQNRGFPSALYEQALNGKFILPLPCSSISELLDENTGSNAYLLGCQLRQTTILRLHEMALLDVLQ